MNKIKIIKSTIKDNLKNTILAGQSLAVLLVTIVVLLLCGLPLTTILICIPLNFITSWLTILFLSSCRKTLEYSEDPFYILEPPIILIITVAKFVFLTTSKTIDYLPRIVFIVVFFIALTDWTYFLNLKKVFSSASPQDMQMILRSILYLTVFISMTDVIIFRMKD